MNHTIDAKDQTLGRLAGKIAVILRGKHNPDFQPHIMANEKVTVTNVGQLRFTGNKLKNKIYYRYSGYPGGIYARTLAEMFEKYPDKLVRNAVMSMLPKNRMRSKLIKNLEIQI